MFLKHNCEEVSFIHNRGTVCCVVFRLFSGGVFMMFYGLPPVASLVEIPKSVGTIWSHSSLYIYTQIHIYRILQMHPLSSEIMSNGFSDCAFRTTAGVELTMRFLGWGRLRSLGWFQWKKWWRTVGFQWVFTSFHQLSVGFSYQVSLETAWRVFACVVHCFLPLFLFRFRWDQNP